MKQHAGICSAMMKLQGCVDFHFLARDVKMMWRGAGHLRTQWSVETRRFMMYTKLLSKLCWGTLGCTSLEYYFFCNKEKHARLFPRRCQSSSGKYGAFHCFRKEPDQCLRGTAVFKICLSPWPVQVSPIFNRFECIVSKISNSVGLYQILRMFVLLLIVSSLLYWNGQGMAVNWFISDCNIVLWWNTYIKALSVSYSTLIHIVIMNITEMH